MAKRFILALIFFFAFPMQQIPADAKEANHSYAAGIHIAADVGNAIAASAIEAETDRKVPAKEAHEHSEKWVNILLIVIFIIAAIGFAAIGIVMRKSKK